MNISSDTGFKESSGLKPRYFLARHVIIYFPVWGKHVAFQTEFVIGSVNNRAIT